ncbi:MAG: proton-conducting transporter membrane subunit [Acidobacteriota bacterium]|nr:proton-conducting transporter membrane subunit [Acidobacteriota bacterium]
MLWLIGVPALAAILEYALGRRAPVVTGKIAIVGAACTFGFALDLLRSVLQHGAVSAAANQLRADALSALVASVVSCVGFFAIAYAYPYLGREVREGHLAAEKLPAYYALSLTFVSTMTAVTVTNNIIMMYVLVEATTLASALLVTFYGTPKALEAGYKYLLLCSVGIAIGLLGCVVLYASAVPFVGGIKGMEISEIVRVAHNFPPLTVLVGTLLVIIGFGSKAGFVPFHAWLPDAHSQSPSPVSAMLSGVTLKVALYAIARIATIFYPGHGALGIFCIVLGAVTMLFGIIVAFNQTDLKRMLAYSSVSQIGYILMGLGLANYLGFYGATYHLLNHALDKSMLFLCSGVLLYACGTTNMDELGKRKHSALLAICFFIGALAISGVPPLNGFWSKFAIYTAAAQAHMWWALGVAMFTSMLTLAVLVRAGYTIFLQEPEHGSEDVAHLLDKPEPDAVVDAPYPAGMMAAIAAMCVLIVISGMNLRVLHHAIDQSVQALLHQMAGG